MNVLFITIDQWRADWLGANGNQIVETPNLDRLAKAGSLFKKHFTCSAPCGPSRATLHTGMYPSNHRAVRNGTPLNANLTNLAKEARKQGYEPTLFGYTDITADPRYKDRGDPDLATYEGVMEGYFVGARLNEQSKAWLTDLKSKGYDIPKAGYDIYHPDPDFELPEDRHLSYAPARFKAADSETAWLTNRALEFLQAQFGDPFFCHVSYLRPHPPFIAPPEYHDKYDPDDMAEPKHFGDVTTISESHPFLQYSMDTIKQSTFMMSEEGLTKDLTEAEVRQIRATYSALVSEVDSNVGRLLDMLEKTGELDNTLIVVTADHGEQLGDHHLFGKLGFYDQSFHIPLIVKAPKSLNIDPSEIEEFSESIDIMPTILECLGAKPPAQCDGISLLPLMRGDKPENWRDAVHWLYDFRDIEHGDPETALGLDHDECNLLVYRDQNFKYVHFASLPPLLFDLVNDPDETRNLAEEPDYQAVVLDYAQKLLSWRMKNEFGALDRYVVSDDGQMLYGD
ncbi:alkaline phosphatase family protein [Sneathiella limimaris]|uniref:alkaline phosphatase family protein n=1 Tax=Sneathiella limimaris TaxID=1964213 RepID=UPI00146F60CD|nr:alkaline phosphatase family protein [Sneathiella limimaris]